MKLLHKGSFPPIKWHVNKILEFWSKLDTSTPFCQVYNSFSSKINTMCSVFPCITNPKTVVGFDFGILTIWLVTINIKIISLSLSLSITHTHTHTPAVTISLLLVVLLLSFLCVCVCVFVFLLFCSIWQQ